MNTPNVDQSYARKVRLRQKKIKKSIFLSSLIIVCAALIVVYIAFFKKSNDTSGNTESDQTIILADFKTSDILSISYTLEDSDEVVLNYSSNTNTWTYSADKDYPINQSLVSQMASSIVSLTATREISDVTDLSQFGLDDPDIVVNVVYSGDKEYEYMVGDYNDYNKCYYYKISGSDSIYTVTDNISAYFKYDLNGLTQIDSLPTISDENIVSCVVTYPDGKTETYTDTDLLSLIPSLKLLEWIEYSPDESKLDEYGLSGTDAHIITVNYTEERSLAVDDASSEMSGSTITVDLSYQLKVGKKTEDETFRYVMYDNSKLLYKVDSSILEALILGVNNTAEADGIINDANENK